VIRAEVHLEVKTVLWQETTTWQEESDSVAGNGDVPPAPVSRAPVSQIEPWEVLSEHEEEFLHSEGEGTLKQAAQGGCGVSPSLKIFKTCLNKVLCSLL